MLSWKRIAAASLALGSFFAGSAYAAGLSESATVAHNTPKFVKTSRIMGPVDPTTVMEVSLWLKPHDQAGLDALAKQLYDKSSSQYRHFLTKAQYSERFAPTAAEAGTVAQFLAANRLKVVAVGPDNFFVRASGTAASISAAFHVELNNYEVNGKTVRANAADPTIEGEAAPLVAAVHGLDTMEYSHPNKSWKTLSPALAKQAAAGGVTSAAKPVSDLLPSSAFTSNCLPGVTSQSFSTNGDGELPKATYKGNLYTTANSGCGYTPPEIQKAYGLTALYKAGLDGTGQTIVILDWCGSPTITSDANAFSKQFGLPALTSSNFKIIYTPTRSTCAAPDPEINIDVEWAHAIAPGAKIDLVVPPSATFQDVDEGLFYAVDYQLGNNISGSYGSEELYTSPAVLITENLIAETAAVLGISANFSSGDDGDFTFDFPQYDPPSVSAPADSPYATAVGGVSLFLAPNGTISSQVGWGTNENLLYDEGYVPDPPGNDAFFNFGSGGGESGFFAKPLYQRNLPGSGRQLPDISWLADPFTGGYIAISVPFATPELQYEVYGGTSLACPMFSGLWAIANQAAGLPLGQAAPYLYSLPSNAIMDVLPQTSKTNVTGVVTDSSGKTNYTAAELAAVPGYAQPFISAIWDYPLDELNILLTFGTDSGLNVTKGWDNVTGLGTPSGTDFVRAFMP